MFVGKSWYSGPAAISIDEALADVDLMADSQESQGHIDAMVSILVQEIGLTPDEIVEFPVLFEFDASYGALVAYNPGTVNSLVFNDYIVIPDPTSSSRISSIGSEGRASVWASTEKA
jgi:hypothetical protein